MHGNSPYENCMAILFLICIQPGCVTLFSKVIRQTEQQSGTAARNLELYTGFTQLLASPVQCRRQITESRRWLSATLQRRLTSTDSKPNQDQDTESHRRNEVLTASSRICLKAVSIMLSTISNTTGWTWKGH